MTGEKQTPKSDRLLGVRLNWKIALAVCVPLALAFVGSAVYGCSLNIGISGIALTCKDSK
tara:strand:- start:676 stop:855 length:180 start_codon:yes stop_codon:yes gene_type:complete